MSEFGDYDGADDAADTAPHDPEQVARKLHRLRRARGFEAGQWEGLDDHVRAELVALVADLLAWLQRSRPGD